MASNLQFYLTLFWFYAVAGMFLSLGPLALRCKWQGVPYWKALLFALAILPIWPIYEVWRALK